MVNLCVHWLGLLLTPRHVQPVRPTLVSLLVPAFGCLGNWAVGKRYCKKTWKDTVSWDKKIYIHTISRLLRRACLSGWPSWPSGRPGRSWPYCPLLAFHTHFSRGTMDFRTVRKRVILSENGLPLGMTTTSHGKVNLVVSHFSRLFKSSARVKVCLFMFVKCCMIYLETHTCLYIQITLILPVIDTPTCDN